MKIYVLQVKPGCEILTAQTLKNRGFSVICPVEKSYIRISGKWHEREKLVFNQYIFVEYNLTDKNYYKIKSAFGVVKFLGFGKPEPLPQTAI